MKNETENDNNNIIIETAKLNIGGTQNEPWMNAGTQDKRAEMFALVGIGQALIAIAEELQKLNARPQSPSAKSGPFGLNT